MGDRQLQQLNTISVKQKLADLGIPVVPGPSHIIPALVGDADLAKQASDMLLSKHKIYVQSINYPTVARGEERLRITPTPGHSIESQDQLVAALDNVWNTLGLKRTADWAREGGRANVGVANYKQVERIWTEAQLGLLDGTAPPMLAKGPGPMRKETIQQQQQQQQTTTDFFAPNPVATSA
jgi:5-aminolevulinate synthase